MRINRKIALVMGTAALLILVSSIIVNAFPRIANWYADTNLDQRRCVDHAKDVARDAGYTNVRSEGGTTYFLAGEYNGGIACVADHSIVFFYAAGENMDHCKAIVSYIKEHGRWMRR